ncbi:hypothetical protein D6D13_04660 [Aureobasidium pullulans]|uniref:Copper acquisition factor BIM1-like domain-containing protein n=1 Tax=Aureobasidium pullulans TaxID=5580 RepID=A0A4S9CWV1_AURPU|nr:hypothetical protein D6D13_04660 [Aureobasidium pullulans]
MKGILSIFAAFGLQLAIVLAHTVITYPPWRGNNLITNGTEPQYDMIATGENCVDGQKTFPYGQQWMYPCGGMPMSTNRSLWPVSGGAVALQPGWFQGHKTAMFYVNIGINGPGEVAPPNMSHPVVAPFQITGPANVEYPGSFCLPQVPLVPGVTFNIGDNVTIQVIELAQHGAAIYNCADVTLADPADVPEVNASNCFNSSDLSFQLVYATGNLSSSALPAFTPSSPMSHTLPLLVAIFAFVLW